MESRVDGRSAHISTTGPTTASSTEISMRAPSRNERKVSDRPPKKPRDKRPSRDLHPHPGLDEGHEEEHRREGEDGINPPPSHHEVITCNLY